MPLPLAALTLAGTAASAGMKFMAANKQMNQAAAARKKARRPTRNVNEQIRKQVELSEMQMNTGMPGSDVVRDRMKGNVSDAVEKAKAVSQDPGATLDAVTKLNRNQQNAELDLGISEAEFDLSNLDRYMGSLTNLANEELAVYSEELQRYYDNAGAASALEYAGNMNRQTAADEFISGVGLFANNFLGAEGLKLGADNQPSEEAIAAEQSARLMQQGGSRASRSMPENFVAPPVFGDSGGSAVGKPMNPALTIPTSFGSYPIEQLMEIANNPNTPSKQAEEIQRILSTIGG